MLPCIGGHNSRKKYSAISLRFVPLVEKFKYCGGRDYLEIGKSVCCQVLSAGSHMTGSQYLRTKLEHCKKLRDQGGFKKFNFQKIFIFFYLKRMIYDILIFFTI